MTLSGTFTFRGPRALVWQLLQDPDVLVKVMPGAQRLVCVADGRYQGVLHYLSFTDHYSTLLRDSFDSVDVAFYILFIATFLGLSIRRLDSARLQA